MYKILIFFLLITKSCSFRTDRYSYSSRQVKLYVELGESGIIASNNISFAKSNETGEEFLYRDYRVLKLQTCPSCIISIRFRYLDLKDRCAKKSKIFDVNTCRCEYIWIAESSYEHVSGKLFCGFWNSTATNGKAEPGFISQTSTVIITFFYVDEAPHEFKIYYASEQNRYFFSGNFQASDGGVISSPFFPENYPRNIVSEYIIQCLKYETNAQDPIVNFTSLDNNCRIRLAFTDFQLSTSSVMEFFDENQERIELVSGSSFRPRIIVTKSSSLTIRFTANGGDSYGFKAQYFFVPGNYSYPLLEPHTNCGGQVEVLGGVITMLNMVKTGIKAFDCIWLIRPPEDFFPLNGHIYLKVNSFSNFAGYAQLEIREGLFSESPLLEKILYSSPHPLAEHIVSVRSGFYINLKAAFRPSTILGITFTSFHCNKCYPGLEYSCRNHRCISRKVVCDGFDHCGDNSDELEVCNTELKIPRESEKKWSGLIPNYYFPKMNHNSELKTAVSVFIIVSLGLVIFLAFLVTVVYRMGSKRRQDREFHGRLNAVSEFLDDAEIEEIIDDEPPGYEAPPDYEATLKKGAPQKNTTNVLQVPGQLSDDSINDKRFVIVIPETLSMSDETGSVIEEKCADSVKIGGMGQNKKLIPDSPPPPYNEDERIMEFSNLEPGCVRASESKFSLHSETGEFQGEELTTADTECNI